MENFPIELLTKIFGFLHPIYDRLARFSVVCHRWKEIIQKTSSLWEHIHLKPLQLTEKEKNIVFRCLREYDAFIKCLRVASLDVVFGDGFWFFIHRVTLEMTNLACLDIPTFPWNLEQFMAFRSAENLKELNLYGFWDLSDIQWTQNYSQPVSLINPGHLQLVKVRCTKLEVLKLSINMLRLPEEALIEFLNGLNLKELQISAYNGSEVNIPINRSSLKLLRCLLSSNYVSIITKLDLRYISIGHKELRLILKLLKSLRYLKLCFLDIHRCMTGYQYLASDSLEYFELDELPAKNIMRLKCSMPKLRYLMIIGCSNLKSLQVVSSMLEQLFLSLLANLQSLHVTSTTLKHFEVANCGSLTSKTIDKVLQHNRRIERCTIRGHLVNFQFSQMEAGGVLTELCLWITDFCKLQRIHVHCPTLKSFMCNHHNSDGELSIPTPDSCIDVQCNDLLDAYISVPQINSIDIKCKTITQLLLNVGEQKLYMLCCTVRVSAEKRLKTFCANKCIFTRVEINAEKVDNLDFNKCRIKGELKLDGNCIDMISMRNVIQSQENIDLIARCDEIRKVNLRECDTLCTVTVFPDETHLYDTSQIEHTELQTLQVPSSDSYSYNIHGNVSGTEREEAVLDIITSRVDVAGSTMKEVVKTIATLNCPCFRGLMLHTKKNKSTTTPSSEPLDSASCHKQHPRTCAEIQEVDSAFNNSGGSSEVPEVEMYSEVLNLNLVDCNSGSSLVLQGCEDCLAEEKEHSTNEEDLQDNHQGKIKQKGGYESVNRFVSLTEDHTGDTSCSTSVIYTKEQIKDELDTPSNDQHMQCETCADFDATTVT